MKKLSTTQLAMSYTGIFLGAGFVSGQELWQFFACFGPVGLIGFIGTAALFFYVNYANLRLIQLTGQEDMGRLMTCGDHPKLRAAVSAMQNLLLVGVCIIMIAGASTLIHQLLPIPAWLGGLIFTVIVAAVALLGMQGLVAVFSLLVPVTTVMAMLLAAWVLIKNGFSFAPANGSVSALMPNWIIGFVTYAAYNLFGTISILVPTAKLMDGKKTVRRGLSMGSVLLIVLAWSMIAAISVLPSSGQNELPMSALASGLHPTLSVAYSLLMGFGMFGACLSSICAVVSQTELHFAGINKHGKLFTTALLLVSFALSLLGFGNLIGIIYPVFGYASIPFLICLVLNYHKVKKTGTL